ncbi:MAG: UbiA family prenyltransferase [Hyphomicrobiaceae bacterium]|nr:UbiA family prenyltransferase [Hyphomicrobiaceae bacterium]MCC0025111.1 UbiA family prenyltransferase [Hyphomicrobiaceae bacterium]
MTLQKALETDNSGIGAGSHKPPLVLDLDGALLRTDLLHEAAAGYVKSEPLGLFRLPQWLFRGKAALKRELNEHHNLDVEFLPVNEELVEYAAWEHAQGRLVGIATASDELVARRVAKRFDFIDFVIASDGVTNLKGKAKADALRERFPDGFAYAADAQADLAVWKEANAILLAGASARTAEAAGRLGKNIEARFDTPKLGLKGWAKAMRVHQWAKNALVFVPLILSGMASNPMAVASALVAFFAMSFMASGTYLINDLFDLADDRRHWTKKERPLPSGALSIAKAVPASLGLLALALGMAASLGWVALGLVATYLSLTLGYSLYIKRQPIIDAFALACLFTLRLGVGIAAVGAAPSAWLLVFSMFLFASLSFAKRQTEVQKSARDGRKKVNGRGYNVDDAPMILAMGISTGMAAVLIMVLYLMNDAFNANFYDAPLFLWAFPIVLFLWVSRIWLLSHREELNDDPVAFAVRDRLSLMLGGVMGAAFLAGWLL